LHTITPDNHELQQLKPRPYQHSLTG
jgi:hypothetical protein